jgi:hypothetical protein
LIGEYGDLSFFIADGLRSSELTGLAEEKPEQGGNFGAVSELSVGVQICDEQDRRGE